MALSSNDSQFTPALSPLDRERYTPAGARSRRPFSMTKKEARPEKPAKVFGADSKTMFLISGFLTVFILAYVHNIYNMKSTYRKQKFFNYFSIALRAPNCAIRRAEKMLLTNSSESRSRTISFTSFLIMADLSLAE